MVETQQLVINWFVAGLLLLLLTLSLSSPGTWMGGIGVFWMIAAPVALLALAIYLSMLASRREPREPRAPS